MIERQGISDEVLAKASIAELAEHLARRIKLADGEIRIQVKDGRYQRAAAVLPISALPR